ncbi:hypothetical protein B0H13DRAFT_2335643 [Mycena leptocephala]|nr:hypothetical protein B0H13DRAFT_2335643 [Mycena leptocephala]
MGSVKDQRLAHAGHHTASRSAIIQSTQVWRTAALGDPSLWTEIFVDNATFSNMERFSTYVRRAGHLPIHLAIALYQEKAHHRAVIPVNDFLDALFEVPEFMQAIERCTEFTILSTHISPTVQLLSYLKNETFPVLHSLNTDVPRMVQRTNGVHYDGVHYGELTDAQRQGMYFYIDVLAPELKTWRMARSFIPWSLQTLTELRLESLSSDIQVTWSELTDVLVAPPGLSRLYLHDVSFEGDDGSRDKQMPKLQCILPRVTHFSLAISGLRNGTLQIITALHFPALETFECRVPHQGWLMLASPLSSILQTVRVAIFTLVKKDYIRRLLPVSQHIRLLDLRNCEGFSVLDDLATALANAKGPLCPALSQLLVSENSTVNEINALLSRRVVGKFSPDFVLVCPYPTSALSGLGRHILHKFRYVDGQLEQGAVSIGNYFEETA